MTDGLRKLIFGSLWLGLIAYALLAAPADAPQTLEQIIQLSTGQWQQLNPLVVALFNLMGIWPLVYAMLLLPDGQAQRDQGKSLRAWPFVVGSFGLGAFALLPYLALRSPPARHGLTAPASDQPGTGASEGRVIVPEEMETSGKTLGIVPLLRRRGLPLLALLGTAALLAYGLSQGDWADFANQWRSSRFIHVMSLDFVLLTLLFPTLAQDDARCQGIAHPQRVWATVLLPLLGAGLYLLGRPSVAPRPGAAAGTD